MQNPPSTWLTSPIWQGVGAIAGVIAVGVTLALAYLARRRRRLAFGYTTFPLVSINKEVKDKVRVVFDGQIVQNVHLQNLSIVNIGNVPIRRDDFEHPLAIFFSRDARALSAELVHRHPSELKVSLQLEEDGEGYITRVLIAPLLLNPADGFRIRVLVAGASDGKQPVSDMSARIAGVTRVDWFDGDTEAGHLRLVRGLFAALPIVLVTSFLPLFPRISKWVLAVPAFVGGFIILLLAVASFMILGHSLMKRFDPYRHLR
jgi:hypothetical protein